MPLYFAYGSNMDRAAMAARCPASTVLGIARLARHRFIIAREGYASVARDPRRAVWGLLWDLALADIPALDRYESVASRLYVKVTQPVLTDFGAKRALVYVARSSEPALPRPGYLSALLTAAREAGLPGDYLREIAALLPPTASTNRSPGASEARPAPKVRPLFASPLANKPERP